MRRDLWRKRVVVNPKIHHGEPCIKGTRIPAVIIVGSVADGMTHEEIIRHYPQLAKEDIVAALQYAAKVLESEIVPPQGTCQ